jgi:hypothetical protein
MNDGTKLILMVLIVMAGLVLAVLMIGGAS